MDRTQADRREIEATLFAMELLMPAHFIEKRLEKHLPLDMEGDLIIPKMALEYGVSVQLMTIRLTHLGYLGV